MMKRQSALLFYILGIYVVIQFVWWGYHLIDLTKELKVQEELISKRIMMIISEGLVFFLLLLLGLLKIRNSFKKELQFSERENNFLLSVTHELKTPLTANKLYLQTLQKRALEPEKQKELIGKALDENERLELMIENILNASRLENKTYKPVFSKLDLSNELLEIVDHFHKRYQNTFIKTQIQNDIWLHSDPFLIQTIFNNLIENAIKYAGMDRCIEVYLFKENDLLKMGVKDQGLGIDYKYHKDVFYKFFRIGNEETRVQKGTGLGLYIVSEFVKLQGGRIILLHNVPLGSNFEISLKHDK